MLPRRLRARMAAQPPTLITTDTPMDDVDGIVVEGGPAGYCCETHAGLWADGVQPPPPIDANSNDNAWFVLVGGEGYIEGEHPRPLGLHCSLPHIGKAYGQIVDIVGRDNIIVITQLQEVLDWLDEAVETGFPLFSPNLTVEGSKERWADHRDFTRASCARLIEDGGAHYDGTDVNPATLIRVITGDADAAGGPVIPKGEGRSVCLALYSHGWSHSSIGPEEMHLHSTVACDICGEMHGPNTKCETHSSLMTREWFFFFPYDSPDISFYETVATSQAKRPYTKLYWQQLFQASHNMLLDAPSRSITTLYNFCGAGGFVKFMDLPVHKNYSRVGKWPLFLVASAGEMEGAICGLVQTWFSLLSEVLMDSKSDMSLHDFYRAVELRYYEENPALTHQTYWVYNPCLMCRQFRGMRNWHNLCSMCFKKYNQLPDAEKPDLAELAKQNFDPESPVPQDNQAFKMKYGMQAMADTSIRLLFDNRVTTA